MRARQQVILGNLMNSLTRLNSLKTAQVQLISHLFFPQFAALRNLMTSMTCIAFVILTGSNYPIARNGGILIHFVVVSIVDKVGKNSGLHWFCFTFFSDWSRKLAPLSQPIRCTSVARVFPRFWQFAGFYFEFQKYFFFFWLAVVITIFLHLRHSAEKCFILQQVNANLKFNVLVINVFNLSFYC